MKMYTRWNLTNTLANILAAALNHAMRRMCLCIWTEHMQRIPWRTLRSHHRRLQGRQTIGSQTRSADCTNLETHLEPALHQDGGVTNMTSQANRSRWASTSVMRSRDISRSTWRRKLIKIIDLSSVNFRHVKWPGKDLSRNASS